MYRTWIEPASRDVSNLVRYVYCRRQLQKEVSEHPKRTVGILDTLYMNELGKSRNRKASRPPVTQSPGSQRVMPAAVHKSHSPRANQAKGQHHARCRRWAGRAPPSDQFLLALLLAAANRPRSCHLWFALGCWLRDVGCGSAGTLRLEGAFQNSAKGTARGRALCGKQVGGAGSAGACACGGER